MMSKINMQKIVYEEDIVTVDQMLKKIREIGYDAEVAGIDEKDE